MVEDRKVVDGPGVLLRIELDLKNVDACFLNACMIHAIRSGEKFVMREASDWL